MHENTFAVIDLGTNTFNLLVSKVQNNKLVPLLEDRVSVKIGKGGIQNRLITDDACKRAIEAIDYFRKQADEYGANKIKATATSAFRNAVNGPDLAAQIQKETGIEVEIIDGNREAELIYRGVRAALDLGIEPSLIMDIGGGSVEFILCNQQQIFWKKSYEIGAQRLLDRFQKTDPMLREDMDEMNGYLDAELTELAEILKLWKPGVLIGSSGTFDTLCEIYIARHFLPLHLYKHTEFELPVNEYADIHQIILPLNRNQRLRIPGMVEMRSDMIVVASCLLHYIIFGFGFHKLRVSFYSLKEGLMQELMNT